MSDETTGPYRDGKIYVHSERCLTCVFRPDGLRLAPGRLKEMVDRARAGWSVIPCHETLDGDKAVCAGYASVTPQPDCLQVGERLGILEFVDLPTDWPR